MTDKNLNNHRLFFSDLGFAYVAFAIISFVIQYIISYGVKSYAPNFYESQFFLWVGSFLPMYLIAFPICLLVFKNIEKTTITKNKLGIKKYILILLICFGAMIAGNLIGKLFTFVFNKLFGYTAPITLNEMILSSKMIYLIIFPVILAPIVEELLFRKLLIDRAIKYGELTAILLSGILFGLFHGNFEQFFYAAFLGSIFAYVYIKTGLLRYTISFHMIINFLGSVVPVFILSRLDETTRNAIISGNTEGINYSPEVILSLTYSLLYSLSMFVLAIIGIVLLIKSIKKIQLQKSELKLNKNELLTAIFFNLGMPSFLIICALKFILNI